MGLFAIDDDVGPGLPLWLPKGAAIVEELEKLAKETEFAAGYVRVKTPHIAQGEDVSNHRPSAATYAESMFPPMALLRQDRTSEALNAAIRSKACESACDS